MFKEALGYGSFLEFFQRLFQTGAVLSSGRCQTRLSASASHDEPGSAAYVLSGVLAGCDQISRVHEGELRLAFPFDGCGKRGVFRVFLE